MISGLITASIATAMLVSIITPLGCLAFCLKVRRGKRENLFFNAAIGLAALMVATNLSRLFLSIPPLAELTTKAFPAFIILASVSIGAFEILARYFTVSYTAKISGTSFYRTVVIGTGIGAGQVLLNASTYSQYLNQAKMINNGTFVDSVIEQQLLTKTEALQYQETFASLNPWDFFGKALDHGTMIFVEIAIALIFVYLLMEHKKVAAIVISGAVRAAYELFRMFITFAPSEYLGKVMSVDVSNIVNAVVLLACLGASIYVILLMKKKMTQELPPTRQRPGQPAGSSRSKAQAQETLQQRKAWQEIRELKLSGRSSNMAEEDAGRYAGTIDLPHVEEPSAVKETNKKDDFSGEKAEDDKDRP